MTDREALSVFLAEAVGCRPVSGPLRHLVLQLVALPKVRQRRWPSLTAADVQDQAADYLARLREAELAA